MNYYHCTIISEKQNKSTKDVYYITGKIEVKGNKLYFHDGTGCQFAIYIFDKSYWKLDTPAFANGFEKTPRGFFDYMNKAFCNYTHGYYSADELTDKVIQYGSSYNESVPLYGVFNLDSNTYELTKAYEQYI
jgi:hypothetical protein